MKYFYNKKCYFSATNLKPDSLQPDIFILWTHLTTLHDCIPGSLHPTSDLFKPGSCNPARGMLGVGIDH